MSRNSGLKVLSLVLAVILWSYVRITVGGFAQTRIVQMTINVDLQVKGENSLILFEQSHSSIQVTLRGDSKIIESIKKGLVSAFVDIDGFRAGVHAPEVKVIAPPGVDVVEKFPASVTIRLSPYMVKEVPLVVEPTGQAKKGYEVGAPSHTPSTIKVSGPEALLSQVESVLAPVPIQNREKSFATQVMELKAVNENKTEVMGSGKSILMSPKEVSVMIPIEKAETILNLPVVLDRVKYEQLPGFKPKLVVEPQFVQVGSRLPEGESVPSGISTESVTFAAVKSPQQKVVGLENLEGIEIKGSDKVTLTLTQEKIERPADSEE